MAEDEQLVSVACVIRYIDFSPYGRRPSVRFAQYDNFACSVILSKAKNLLKAYL